MGGWRDEKEKYKAKGQGILIRRQVIAVSLLSLVPNTHIDLT